MSATEQASAGASPRNGAGLSLALAAALAAVVAALYANTLSNPFVFDDEPNIVLNESIRDLRGTLGGTLADAATLHPTRLRPLNDLTLSINYALGALNPVGYHLVNTAIHAIAAVALFGVMRRTLLLPRWEGRFDRDAVWWAFAAALLWAAHPLNTQAVTYTIQRAESMMAMFFLLSLYAAVRQATARSGGTRGAWTATALAAAFLGGLTKEVVVVLPLVVAAYDWVMLPFGPELTAAGRTGSFKRWFAQRAALVGGLGLLSAYLLVRSLGPATQADTSAGLGLPVVGPLGYLISQFGVIVHYLRLAVWPDPLILDYLWLPAVPRDTPGHLVATLWLTRVVPFAVPIVLLFAASVYGLVRRRWWGFCGVAFFLILAPTSSVLPIADLAVEHRMYLPLTCVVVVVVFAAAALLRRVAKEKAAQAGALLLVVAAAALGGRTVIRNYDYVSAVAVWDRVTVDRPRNPRGWQNLGAELLKTGRREEAKFCFEMVLSILPSYAAAHAGMGDIYIEDHDPASALAHYERAVELAPRVASHHYDFGRALLMVGQFAQAETHSRAAIELQKEYPKAYNNLGLALVQQGRPDEALAAFRTSVEQDPRQTDAYVNLSITLEKQGDLPEAIAVMERAAASPRDDKLTDEQRDRFNRRLAEVRKRATPAPVSP